MSNITTNAAAVREVVNYREEKVILTPLENEVYEHLKDFSEMEDSYCDCPENISNETGIPMKQLRGVISSLDKKGVAYVEELVSGCGKWVILCEEK